MPRSVLQEEIKKKNPFDVPEQEAVLNLFRTADRFGLEFCRLFRAHGITGPQYNILRILRGVGDPGLPSLEIASRMIACVPDITRLLDRLEEAGLVCRQRCREDRRVVFARITPKGLKLLDQLDGPDVETHRRLLGHLSREELAELIRLLVKARRPAE